MAESADPQPSDELAGRLIGITAERRAHQQVRYLTSRGAATHWAPVLRTVDGADRPQLLEAAKAAINQPPDVLIVQTGQGLRWWLETLPSDHAAALIKSLSDTAIWCRGSKAASAVRHAGLGVSWMAPNESTRDIAQHLGAVDLTGRRVLIQLDGSEDQQLLRAAEAGSADVFGLDVYRYRLPDDRGPAQELIAAVVSGKMDAVTFTASPQIRHLREIAAELGQQADLDLAFGNNCLASVVGPVCAETARTAGWSNIIEPETPRLLPMLESLRSELA